VSIWDFLKHPGGGKARGWDALPQTTDLAPLGQQKAVTFNGAEYVTAPVRPKPTRRSWMGMPEEATATRPSSPA
jgi:hypothetical protein